MSAAAVCVAHQRTWASTASMLQVAAVPHCAVGPAESSYLYPNRKGRDVIYPKRCIHQRWYESD